MKRIASCLHKAFTLLDLTIVLVILGIFAGIVVPRYIHLLGLSKIKAEQNAVESIRAGIAAGNPYPKALDVATTGECAAVNPCFTNVMAQPIIDSSWSRTITGYTGPDGGAYVYTADNGTFQKMQ